MELNCVKHFMHLLEFQSQFNAASYAPRHNAEDTLLKASKGYFPTSSLLRGCHTPCSYGPGVFYNTFRQK